MKHDGEGGGGGGKLVGDVKPYLSQNYSTLSLPSDLIDFTVSNARRFYSSK